MSRLLLGAVLFLSAYVCAQGYRLVEEHTRSDAEGGSILESRSILVFRSGYEFVRADAFSLTRGETDGGWDTSDEEVRARQTNGRRPC